MDTDLLFKAIYKNTKHFIFVQAYKIIYMLVLILFISCKTNSITHLPANRAYISFVTSIGNIKKLDELHDYVIITVDIKTGDIVRKQKLGLFTFVDTKPVFFDDSTRCFFIAQNDNEQKAGIIEYNILTGDWKWYNSSFENNPRFLKPRVSADGDILISHYSKTEKGYPITLFNIADNKIKKVFYSPLPYYSAVINNGDILFTPQHIAIDGVDCVYACANDSYDTTIWFKTKNPDNGCHYIYSYKDNFFIDNSENNIIDASTGNTIFKSGRKIIALDANAKTIMQQDLANPFGTYTIIHFFEWNNKLFFLYGSSWQADSDGICKIWLYEYDENMPAFIKLDTDAFFNFPVFNLNYLMGNYFISIYYDNSENKLYEACFDMSTKQLVYNRALSL